MISLPTKVRHRCSVLLRMVLFIGILTTPPICAAQAKPASGQTPLTVPERASKPASGVSIRTDRERAELLQIIHKLQERVTKLEAQVTGARPPTAPDAKPVSTTIASEAPAQQEAVATSTGTESLSHAPVLKPLSKPKSTRSLALTL
jgi:hypothetical protein